MLAIGEWLAKALYPSLVESLFCAVCDWLQLLLLFDQRWCIMMCPGKMIPSHLSWANVKYRIKHGQYSTRSVQYGQYYIVCTGDGRDQNVEVETETLILGLFNCTYSTSTRFFSDKYSANVQLTCQSSAKKSSNLCWSRIIGDSAFLFP